MITKTFTVTIPNEPFTTNTSEGKTVECTYRGPRFVVISTRDGVVQTHEGYFEKAEEYDATQFVDDQDEYHLIDADAHPLEISFLTQEYTNENIDNYEETLPTGEVYDYDYPDDSGILDSVFYRWSDWTYDPATDTFSDLEFHGPLITDEEFANSVQMKLDLVDSIDMSAFDADLVQALQDYKQFFVDVDTTYPGVAKWKIPFPNMPEYPEA
jgi:hypothetical protein